MPPGGEGSVVDVAFAATAATATKPEAGLVDRSIIKPFSFVLLSVHLMSELAVQLVAGVTNMFVGAAMATEEQL